MGGKPGAEASGACDGSEACVVPELGSTSLPAAGLSPEPASPSAETPRAISSPSPTVSRERGGGGGERIELGVEVKTNRHKGTQRPENRPRTRWCPTLTNCSICHAALHGCADSLASGGGLANSAPPIASRLSIRRFAGYGSGCIMRSDICAGTRRPTALPRKHRSANNDGRLHVKTCKRRWVTATLDRDVCFVHDASR